MATYLELVEEYDSSFFDRLSPEAHRFYSSKSFKNLLVSIKSFSSSLEKLEDYDLFKDSLKTDFFDPDFYEIV
jgi:hypothetical protein